MIGTGMRALFPLLFGLLLALACEQADDDAADDDGADDDGADDDGADDDGADDDTETYTFQNIGLGGGGGMFAPSGSPHDPDLLFVSCDMGGFYRSTDGGESWRMLDAWVVGGSTAFSAAFDPGDPDVVYMEHRGGLLVSGDRGLNWSTLAAEDEFGDNALRTMTLDPDDSSLIFAGTASGLYRSEDGGSSFEAVSGVSGEVLGIHVDRSSSPGGTRQVFAATSSTVRCSQDAGLSWADCAGGLPGSLVAFAGGSDTSSVRLYAASSSAVYVSEDAGGSWSPATTGLPPSTTYRFLDTAEDTPLVAYVADAADEWGVYKTTDGGATFDNVYRLHPGQDDPNVAGGWLLHDLTHWWGGAAIGFGVHHPDHAMYTNYGELFVTHDGGTSWAQAHSEQAAGQGAPGPDQRWQSIGLEVTTVWHYLFDPHDADRHYIAYTDIGFARSLDRGATWQHSTDGSPWGNTFYEVAFDPDQPGVLIATAGNQHDIPGWTQLDGPDRPGGVVRSDDYGVTWTSISAGLPFEQDYPTVGLVVDFDTPPATRVMYTAVYGDGVYKTENGGQSWDRRSQGLGTQDNRHVTALHRDSQGTLYALISGRNVGGWTGPGGLYATTDGADSWTSVTGSITLYYPREFAIDPLDDQHILLAASDNNATMDSEGGLWETHDGGGSWTQVLSLLDFPEEILPWVEPFQPVFHPTDPDIQYLSTWSHGLWVTQDGGGSWAWMEEIPFLSIHRVDFDPDDDGTIYVSSYGGGVWKGPALP
jgi:photosystem II stability/assembly factor-like uncharacterized protein